MTRWRVLSGVYTPTMVIAQNLVHLFDVPVLNEGNVQVLVIRCISISHTLSFMVSRD